MYDIIVLGGTFFGMGAAVGHKHECEGTKRLVIERGSQIGYEYISSFCVGSNWCNQPKNHEAVLLRDKLVEHGALSHIGMVHIGGVAPVVNQYIIDKKVDALFMTDAIDVSFDNGLCTVEVVNISGRKRILGKKFYAAPKVNPSGDVYYNAMLCCAGNASVPKTWRDDISFAKGIYENEVILRVRLEAGEMDLLQSRAKMVKLWESRPQEYSEWKIALMAAQIDVISGGRYYDNPIAAFDDGYEVSINE